MGKRTNRRLSEETKRKISAAMKGRTKSEEHRKNISEGLKKYWETIPE